MREEQQRHEDCRKEDMLRWEAMTERMRTPASVTVTSPSPFANLSHRVAKFHALAEGEDAQTYFNAFETHMAGYSVPIVQWINHLAPILTPAATEVFGNIDESERCDYNTVKTALFKHYRVTQESYCSSMDSFKTKSEESWLTCGLRFYHLSKKWVKNCATVESLLALVSWDAIYKLMPR